MASNHQRRCAPGRCVDLQFVAAFRARGARASRAHRDDRRRVVRVVVLMGGAAARALVACCARVELGARRDLGVCHHLGPAGVLMLR